MEDNEKQEVKVKFKSNESTTQPEEATTSQQQERANKSETDGAFSKTSRNNGIASKSDSWFIIGGNHQQVKMILPNHINNQRLYFSCGDIEALNKYSRRICLNDEELIKKIKPCLDYENKIKELKKFIESNLEIADLKINMYISACNKHCLSPYPSYIIEESAVGMESLALINDFIPPVGIMHHYLNKTTAFSPNEHVVNVLHWLFTTFPEPNFGLKDLSNFDRILRKVENLANIKYPAHIFVLKYKRLNEGLWQSEVGEMGTKFAFLPINMEHAHSVVHLGVHPQIFIDGIHGVGIYLSTDLRCCLESTPAQWVWGKSMLGIEIQIILQVEFINHPTVVTYTQNKALCKEQDPYEVDDSTGKLYFLPSHKLVRARYILFYVKTPSTLKSSPSKVMKLKEGQSTNLIVLYKHKLFYLTLTLSAVILARRVRFPTFAKNVFSNIASLPIIKHCLSIVH